MILARRRHQSAQAALQQQNTASPGVTLSIMKNLQALPFGDYLMKRVLVCLTLALGLFSGTLSAQESGDRVLARWAEDGYWYPATVRSVDRQVQLIFDDRTVATVRRNEVRPIDWRVGTKLQCDWQNRGEFFPGAIVSIRGEAISVRYDDGDSERLTVSRCRASYRPVVDQGRNGRR